MTGVFQNALFGFQTGNQYGEQRRRRNALSGAGEMGAGGDWTGAQNALLKGGYLDEANAYGQFGEQARTRQARDAVTTAVQGAGNDPMAGLRAGAGAALQGGDADQFARLTDMANKMDDNQRARASEMQREQANLFAQLSTQNLPPEQAKARVLEALQSVPGMSPETLQRVQQKGLEEFTPDMMRQNGMRFMEAADVFARQDARQERTEEIQYRDSRDQVEDRRWNAQYGLQQRQVANQERAASQPRAAPPLRGADKQLMDTVRDTATSGRGLRALAQEFRSTIAGQPMGPIDGSTMNPGTYFNPQQSAARALASRMTGLMRPTGSGATSDFEQRLYARGAPGLDKPKEANDLIIDGMETLGRLSDARQFFYEDFAEAYGSLNGAERAFQQSEEFRQLTQGGGGGGAPAPRAGGQAGADPLGWR